MGILDFDAVFDILDPARSGYITVDKLQEFDTTLHFTPLIKSHVEIAVRQICGEKVEGRVSKVLFVKVLEELERRRVQEDTARWDFAALDKTGNGRITVNDALLLFKMTHGDRFSLATWNQFLASRTDPVSDLCFDDVRLLLCALPADDTACSSKDLDDEEKRLEKEKEAKMKEECETLQKRQEGDTQYVKQKHDHEETTKRLAKRKLMRWEDDGIEGLLQDDGREYGDSVTKKIRQSIGINDLLDALQAKYETIRGKLFWEMLRKDMGDIVWSSMSGGERIEAFQQLQMEERQARKDGSLATAVKQLRGGSITHNATLLGMMGDLCDTDQKVKAGLQEKRLQLKAQMKSDDEIDNIVRQECMAAASEPTTFGDLLVALQQRYNTEKSSVLGLVQSGTTSQRIGHITHYYCSITRQLELAEFEKEFSAATIAMGLAERRQQYRAERFTPDRLRQENLAALRLAEKKPARRPSDDESTSSSQSGSQGVLELRVGSIHQLALKHEAERDMLMSLLQSRDGKASKTVAKRLTPEKRSNRLTTLRNQRTRWRDKSSVYRSSSKKFHHTMLQEGTSLYYEDTRQMLLSKGRCEVTEEETDSTVLADLQLVQDEEMQSCLPGLHSKDETELSDLKSSTQQLRGQGVMDNVAAVLLGCFQLQETEIPFVKALEKKYDCLRHLVLLHELKLEHMSAWGRLSTKEQSQLMMKKKLEEKRLRHDGLVDEMPHLIPNIIKEVSTLGRMMGEDRTAFAKRVSSLYERQQQLAYMGQDFTKMETDELPDSEVRSVNLLADLNQRFYSEQDHLIRQLRSIATDATEQDRELPLVVLRLEVHHSKLEDWFDIGAIGLGLLERVSEALKERHPTDRIRQVELAKLRVKARQDRFDSGAIYQKLGDGLVPEKGHLLQWMLAYVKEMARKHIEEREQLLSILQDANFEELCEITLVMTDEDKKTRLMELLDKRDKLDLQNPGEREQNVSILEELAALRCALETSPDDSDLPGEEFIILLLVELQDEQDREMARAIVKLTELPEEDLKIVREYEMDARHWEACTNALKVRYKGSVKEEQLIEALEEKYDALRDKLLMEALIAQVGEAEWKLLSEQERQRKLMQLRLEERRLRQEGKLDEITKLLGDDVMNQERLQQLLRDNKAYTDSRLRERLALRTRRLAEGMSEAECDKLEAEEEEEDKKRRNVLMDLQTCFDEEKRALLLALEGQKDHIAAERLRQLELTRLKRDKRRTEEEDKFENAAMMLNLSKEHGDAYEAARERQESLAREHLLARMKARQKRSANEIVGEEFAAVSLPEEDNDVMLLQDAIMKEVELKHQCERELLMALFLEDGMAAHRDKARKIGNEARLDRQEELREAREQWKDSGATDSHQHLQLLMEATGLQFEILYEQFTSDGKDSSDESLQVALLADLQQRQELEADHVLTSLVEKPATVLKDTKAHHSTARERKFYDNVATVVMATDEVAPSFGEDEKLVGELQKKYDTLKDNLFLEALMTQCGEAEWAALSERERQARLVNIRREEKRLRREGKVDEAAALLGDLKDQQQVLAQLLGETRAESKTRLEERLRRRQELKRERESKGLSTDEALLDAIQDEEEETNKSKKRRNILEDLDNHFDDEKAALLAALRNHDNLMDSERQRQLEIAKLRRDRKQLERMEKFDSAAMLMQAAQEQGQQWENRLASEKERQVALARERVAKRRLKKMEVVSSEELAEQLAEESKNATINDDGATVHEKLLDVMDKKQRHERDVLIDLIVAASGDSECQEFAEKVPVEEITAELQKLHGEEEEWKNEVRQQMAPPDGHEMSPDEKDEYFAQVAKNRTELFDRLKKSTALRIKAEKAAISASSPEMSEEDITEETTVQLLTRLQQYQTMENNAFHALMTQNEKEALERLLDAEQAATTEAWLDNVTTTVYTDSLRDVIPQDDTESANAASLKEELEKEFEDEKTALLERKRLASPDAGFDIEAEMARLQAQQESQRKALDQVLTKQKQRVQLQLNEKKMKKECQVYEQDVAAQMVLNAKLNEEQLAETKAGKKGQNQELMQEKLALRREARRRLAEERQTEEELRRDSSGLVSPGGMLKREKTVVDVNLSDSMKEEVFQQLIAQQTTLNKKQFSEQKKREEQLKARLDKMKKRRSFEAADVIQTAEKQRSSLEKAVQGERDRHIMKTKERVERLRYEKTMTMMKKGDKNAKKFDELVSEKDNTPGLTDDDRMQLAAKKMESRFKQEEEEESGRLAEGSIQPQQEGDALKKLKDKRKQKKKQRLQSEEGNW